MEGWWCGGAKVKGPAKQWGHKAIGPQNRSAFEAWVGTTGPQPLGGDARVMNSNSPSPPRSPKSARKCSGL